VNTANEKAWISIMLPFSMDFAGSRNLRTWTSVIGRKSIRLPDEAICSI
jgi:hypothetical protein